MSHPYSWPQGKYLYRQALRAKHTPVPAAMGSYGTYPEYGSLSPMTRWSVPRYMKKEFPVGMGSGMGEALSAARGKRGFTSGSLSPETDWATPRYIRGEPSGVNGLGSGFGQDIMTAEAWLDPCSVGFLSGRISAKLSANAAISAIAKVPGVGAALDVKIRGTIDAHLSTDRLFGYLYSVAVQGKTYLKERVTALLQPFAVDLKASLKSFIEARTELSFIRAEVSAQIDVQITPAKLVGYIDVLFAEIKKFVFDCKSKQISTQPEVQPKEVVQVIAVSPPPPHYTTMAPLPSGPIVASSGFSTYQQEASKCQQAGGQYVTVENPYLLSHKNVCCPKDIDRQCQPNGPIKCHEECHWRHVAIGPQVAAPKKGMGMLALFGLAAAVVLATRK